MCSGINNLILPKIEEDFFSDGIPMAIGPSRILTVKENGQYDVS